MQRDVLSTEIRFSSQLGWRREDSQAHLPSQTVGLHAWWRTVKEGATRQQWEQISDITFHDLRHDFGHPLRAAGFTLEEVAVSLGHVTKKGTPAVATTARYTQPNRE